MTERLWVWALGLAFGAIMLDSLLHSAPCGCAHCREQREREKRLAEVGEV